MNYRTHVNKGGDPEIMRRIHDAYETLMNEEARQKFDTQYTFLSEFDEEGSPVQMALAQTECVPYSAAFRAQHTQLLDICTQKPMAASHLRVPFLEDLDVRLYPKYPHHDVFFCTRKNTVSKEPMNALGNPQEVAQALLSFLKGR